MKILVNIAAYESHNNTYLFSLLKSYQQVCQKGYDVRIIIHTTDHWDTSSAQNLQENFSSCVDPTTSNNQCTVEFDVFPKAITIGLANQHRNSVRWYKNDYDLFIYQEDDMHIELHHIESFIQNTDFLQQSTAYIVGFLRYEIKSDDTTTSGSTVTLNGDIDSYTSNTKEVGSVSGNNKYIFDVPLPRFHLLSINGRPYLTDEYNPHQAMWMLTRDQVLQLDKTCGFLSQQHIRLNQYAITREYMSSFSIFRSSDLFLESQGLTSSLSCNVTKVIPWENFQSFGIHHIRQKYVNPPKYLIRSLATSEAMIKEHVRKSIGDGLHGNGAPTSQLARDTLISFEKIISTYN